MSIPKFQNSKTYYLPKILRIRKFQDLTSVFSKLNSSINFFKSYKFYLQFWSLKHSSSGFSQSSKFT